MLIHLLKVAELSIKIQINIAQLCRTEHLCGRGLFLLMPSFCMLLRGLNTHHFPNYICPALRYEPSLKYEPQIKRE